MMTVRYIDRFFWKRLKTLFFAFWAFAWFTYDTFSQPCTTCPVDCSTGCTTTYAVSSSTDWTPATFDASLGKTGTIQVGSSATATFGSISFASSRSMVINNCGSITHTADMTRTGSGTFTYNNSGTLNYGTNAFDFSGTSDANVFCNNGNVTGGALTYQGTITNYSTGIMTISSITTSGSSDDLDNYGIINVNGTINMSGGGVINSCNAGRITTVNLSLSGSSIVGCAGSCGGLRITGTSTFTGTGGLSGNVDLCDNSGVAPTRAGTPADPKVDSNSGTNVFDASVTYCTCSLLPVSLIRFWAALKEEAVQLKWTTASETGNDYFTIERSMNAVDFEPIATLNGAGNSSRMLNYSYTDQYPYTGINYYRLKQTDFDGKYSYSAIAATEKNKNALGLLFPNPTTGAFTVQLNGQNEDNVSVAIHDVLGREVYYTNAGVDELSGSGNLFVTPYETIPSGIYYVIASSGNKVVKQKLIISK
ncbi:MAG: T9SS type A sorting domain-containing protein [Bacteroidetes bacterium]|nr:T9SS type A sorting domain-containing protein [Bacteroidota bacterium]